MVPRWFGLIIEKCEIVDYICNGQVTYPLDVLRLRLAVEPGSRTMSQVVNPIWDIIISYIYLFGVLVY